MAVVFALALPAAARAQCGGGGPAAWQAGDPLLGVNGTIRALTVWDRDGAGPLAPELVIGGNFQLAGEAVTLNIASWDGSRFRPLASGLGTQPDSVYALTVYNGQLVAAGTFLTASGVEVNAIASFDGTTWDRMGGGVWLDPVGARVYALAVYNNELIVAGLIARAGGQSVRNITKWNGSSWSTMTNGLDGAIYALQVHNGELYAGGSFAASGGNPMGRIAKWNGSSWSSAGGEGLAASGAIVYSLASYAGRLVAGGSLPSVSNLGWLNGNSWQTFAGGVSSIEPASVRTLVVDGGDLFAAGAFSTANGVAVNNVARYNGSNWLATGAGISGTALASTRYAGETVVGGSFMLSAGGTPVGRLAAWNGSSWRAIGRGFNDGVYSILPQGSSVLIAGGAFEYAGNSIAKGVARWNGSSWQPMGAGLESDDGTSANIRAIVTHQGDTIAGGNFSRSGSTPGMNNLARWNGSTWAPVAGGVQGSVFAMLSDPDRNALYVGGSFTRAGTVDAPRVARLVGGSWQSMGAGFSNGTSPANVNCFAIYNNELYAGGNFSSSGGTSVLAIARWDGSAWRPVVNAGSGVGLASGTNAAQVLSMAVHNGELFVGGLFASAGGEPETRALARWNGSRWARVGPPLETDIQFSTVSVSSLLSTADGLIVGGNFTSCAGLPALNIARLQNGSWSALGSGVDVLPPLGGIRTLVSEGTSVLVGGDIRAAGGVASAGVARWQTSTSGGGNVPPNFAGGPASLSRDCGSTLQLSASLVRTEPGVSFRWLRNGVIVANGPRPTGSTIQDSTSLTLTLVNAQPNDSGFWQCEAYNPCGATFSQPITLTINPCTPTGPVCDSIDFNNDGIFPSDQDLQDYLRVVMGAPCPGGRICNDIDFNNDGLYPDDRDLVVLMRVLAGGACE